MPTTPVLTTHCCPGCGNNVHGIRRLAKFLLDSPIQGASCERLFKYFARFHTKVRNRPHTSTTFQSTQIIHNIRRKYPEQNRPGSGIFTRNRMVGADEYIREDNLLFPGSSGTADGDTQEEEDDKKIRNTIFALTKMRIR